MERPAGLSDQTSAANPNPSIQASTHVYTHIHHAAGADSEEQDEEGELNDGSPGPRRSPQAPLERAAAAPHGAATPPPPVGLVCIWGCSQCQCAGVWTIGADCQH